jgi:hypothetical protein
MTSLLKILSDESDKQKPSPELFTGIIRRLSVFEFAYSHQQKQSEMTFKKWTFYIQIQH